MSSFEPSWEEVELPVGPQDLPPWLRDVRVDWNDGYCNRPSLLLKVDRHVTSWPNKVWVNEGRCFTATSEDGLLCQVWSTGPLRREEINGKETLITPPSEGCGGSLMPITLADGTECTVRGPWYHGAPAGYNEFAFVDVSKIDERHVAPRFRRPWWRHTAFGGSFISDDLFLRAMAKHQAGVRVARVHRFKDSPARLEPIHRDWETPKHWVYEAERTGQRPKTWVYLGARAGVTSDGVPA